MAKHSKPVPLIIVAVDFKFKQFDYDRFEIKHLKQYSDVVILDLSYLSSRLFHKGTSAAQYNGDNLKSISSYKQLLSEILLIKNKPNKKNIAVMNFVTPSSCSSLLFLTAVKRLGLKSVKYYNSGVPNISSANNSATLGYIMKALKRRFFFLLSKLFNVYPTHCVYAGDYQKEKYAQAVEKYKAEWLAGNTWDYSNILLEAEPVTNNWEGKENTAVLLDGAGPMFGSDDISIGKKTYITNEVWYPSLVNFFNKIEKLENTSIKIAAHPKTLHQSKPSYFGFREVFYGKTVDMVRESNFVITRGSTAIAYAIIFNKPVVFIYSDELLEDKLKMATTNKMAELLGTKPLNINDEFVDISKYLNVNKACYDLYLKNFLTSVGGLRSNAQVLLEDVLRI